MLPLAGLRRIQIMPVTKLQIVSPRRPSWREFQLLFLCLFPKQELLLQDLLTKWKFEWESATTGRLIYELIPEACLKQQNWTRFEIMFSVNTDLLPPTYTDSTVDRQTCAAVEKKDLAFILQRLVRSLHPGTFPPLRQPICSYGKKAFLQMFIQRSNSITWSNSF
ncbi:hypothetical protein AVEN_200082-1 [Araneus ventricosus]|uniref:Uncharacterized protein n=1 Tax=Araneus ventricosus TaxID=182803 RepID=A0A4Y2TCF5_ARAVE|nr:hypothetical protein AVEN_200082-1 [Araneus ventricosus]